MTTSTRLLILCWLSTLLICFSVSAHQHQSSEGKVTYLANEAVLVEHKHHKVLFDPFFHQHFNHYQLVPEPIKKAVMDNSAPFDDIDAIFISHAHGDHFAAEDMLYYLQQYPKVKLVAPQQAIKQLTALPNSDSVKEQLVSVELAFGDEPKVMKVAGLEFGAVRIPHAGWPGRADIENIVFIVTLPEHAAVMHMGDADPNDDHYLPYKKFWTEQATDLAMPPYWFFSSAEGRDILNEIIKAKQQIGIHVPVKVPVELKNGSHDYFSKPGESRSIIKSEGTK